MTSIRRTLALALPSAALLAVAGCGGGTDAAQTAAIDACDNLCAVQGAPAGCGDATSNCELVCGDVLPGFSDACATKATAYYTCAATLTWACPNGMPTASDASKCATEDSTYTACQGQ
jgi:hypothetical protein